ncbi:MAG: phosphatase PAP2 family protein, partial [Gammaproteobacteria bacterium]|nr:phosphatase PAP2 family protein [Gammaproteobacteria bacterium]
MSSRSNKLGKVAYAVLFVLVVPALLIGWTIATEDRVLLPAPGDPWLGVVVSASGASLMLAGILALWLHGRGLPMGPFPPPVYVAAGAYRLTPHPIYVGFSTLCLGLAMTLESASGMWLVSPCVALGCTALVLGFERQEIRRRFGPQVVQKSLIALPAAAADPPSWWDRASIVVLVFVPWAIAYEAVYQLGVPPDAIEIYLPFERDWPVWQWSEAIYASAYAFVAAALLVVPTNATLRRFAVTGLIATAVVILIYLTVPFVAPPRPFEPHSVLGRMLMFERQMSNTVAAFPAFHALWSFIAAEAWASRSRLYAIFGWSWATLITLSCVTTGMHALADLLAAAVLFAMLRHYRRVWQVLRRAAESIANSWREWRWGGLRIINHGLYAGLGGFVSLFVTACIAGPHAFWQLVFVHIAAVLGAGLWAQTLEGSSPLSRPFGYYGSLLGAGIATVAMGTLGNNTLQLGAAIALAAPWVQAIGRLRCLVQGCCHGSPADEQTGIRYWRERSRVCALGESRGVPLHPTPLYSIMANAVVGVL